MSEYVPDRWVVIKLSRPNGETIRKVLAGWSGGYLTGDSWRLNSGIESEEDCGDYIDFYGYSGSVYKCFKHAEGVNATTGVILAGWEKEAKEKDVIIEVEKYNN